MIVRTSIALVAVTLPVVDDGGTPKIAHMHWSWRDAASERE